jgi:hypothetical protein
LINGISTTLKQIIFPFTINTFPYNSTLNIPYSSTILQTNLTVTSQNFDIENNQGIGMVAPMQYALNNNQNYITSIWSIYKNGNSNTILPFFQPPFIENTHPADYFQRERGTDSVPLFRH